MTKSPSRKISSKWLKCISTQGNIRGVALQATELVQEMVRTHGLGGAGARSLGEAVMGALLIASYCKDKERVNLNIRGSGNIFQALVDAHPDGTVRGYVVESAGSTTVPPAEEENLPDDGIVIEAVEPGRRGPWGEGILSVLRTKDENREQPYIGSVPLLTGYLAKDLTFYWVQSEQIPSAVGLAVNVQGDRVLAAGGFLVQALPGASAAEIRTIEEHINEIQSLARSLDESTDPLRLLSQIFQSTAFVVIEEKPLAFQCNCSWERVRRALTLIGVDELRLMLKEDQSASVRCDFCTKEYRVEAAELQQLIDSVASKEA